MSELGTDVNALLAEALDGNPDSQFFEDIAAAIAGHAVRNHSGERFSRSIKLMTAIHDFVVFCEAENIRARSEA